MITLTIKTSFKDDEEFLDYAKINLLTLLRGWVPMQGDIWRQVPNRRGCYELSRKHDCLEYYRAAAASAKIKKIPFFVYWLILVQQHLLNLPGFHRLSNEKFYIKPQWINRAVEIISRLSEDSKLDARIRDRLKVFMNNFNEHKTRIFGHYQRKDTAKNAILKMAESTPFIIEPIKAEIFHFISQHQVTTWRELRRHNRRLGRIQADVLKWILEDAKKEGRISINIFPTGMFLTYGKSP